MSYPIYDHWTHHGTSLPSESAAPLTVPGPSRLASQVNDIFVGHEWAPPLPVVTTSAAWYSLESAVIEPLTSHTGQEVEILPSDCRYHGDTHGALPSHNAFQQESCAHKCEPQKPAHFNW